MTNARAEWQSTAFALYIDGVRYASPVGNQLVISNLQLTAPSGAQILFNGRVVIVPASTLSVVDGKLTTSLSKVQIATQR